MASPTPALVSGMNYPSPLPATAGLVTSLTYATRHHEMELPQDLALRVLYGCRCVCVCVCVCVAGGA